MDSNFQYAGAVNLIVAPLCAARELKPYAESISGATPAVLFFVSLGERYVEVIADRNIHVRVASDTWDRLVADFIAEDEAHWRSTTADAKITPLPDVARTNGKEPFRLREFEVPSRKSQPFERVATTTDIDKDGNLYLVGIVLSAFSRKGLLAAEAAYLSVLKAY